MRCSGNKMADLPAFTTRTANYLKSTMRWGLQWFPRVTEAVFRQRLDECEKCDQLVNGSHCKHPACGCPVAKKVVRATEECPLRKWLAVTGDDVVPADVKPGKSPRVEVPKSDPATCQHRSPQHHVSVDRRAEPWTATVKIVCRECGEPFTINGQTSANLELARPALDQSTKPQSPSDPDTDS